MSKALELAKFGRETPPAGVVVGDTDAQTLSSKTFSDMPVFSSGTANTVSYLNASKVLSSSTSLSFDGSNLGVGVASPAATLDVYGGASGRLQIYSSASGNFLTSKVAANTGYQILNYLGSQHVWGDGTNTRMVIDASGNVGINTTTPAVKLDIAGAGTAVTQLIWSRGNADAAFVSSLRTGDAGTSAYQSTIGVDYAGYTDFSRIKFYRASTLGEIHFFTGGLSGNGTEKMRITGDGNVGIGTASPSTKLEVAGAAKLTGTNLAIVPSTATSAAYLVNTNTGGNFFFGIDNSTGASFGAGAYGRVLYSSAAYPMAFFTNDLERMRISSAGNVGIGDISPTYKLDVNGEVRITTGLRITAVNSTLYATDGALSRYNATTNGVYLNGNDAGWLALQASGSQKTYINLYGNTEATTPNAINFVTNSVERLRINSTGNSIFSGNVRLYNFVNSGSENNRLAWDNGIYNIGSIRMIIGAGQINRGELGFYVNNGAGEQLAQYIDYAQNVLLTGATTSTVSGAKLQIQTPASQTNAIDVITTGGTTNNGGSFGMFSDAVYISSNWYYAGSQLKRIAANGSANIVLAGANTDTGTYISFGTGTTAAGSPSEKMRIKTDGNVGIGTTNPGARLSLIAETGGQSMLQVRNYGTAATGGFTNSYTAEIRGASSGDQMHGMRIHLNESGYTTDRRTLDVSDYNGIFASFTNGKVGIGTIDPQAKLTIKGQTHTTPWLAVERSGSGNLQFRIFNAENTGYTASSGTVSAPWTNVIDNANSDFMITTLLGGGTGGNIVLDGKVGIGTTGPSGPLHILQGSGGPNTITMSTTFGNGNSYAVNPFIQGVSNGGFSIRDVTNGVDRIAIAYSTGNVGIGTSYPTFKLHVNGTSSFEDTVKHKRFTTHVWENINGGAYYFGDTTAKYEIARIAIDYNDWNSVGQTIIEINQIYYSTGGHSKWSVNYGYVQNARATLLETVGDWTGGTVTIGSPVQISGDVYYLPVYVNVYGYHQVVVKLTTTSTLAADNTIPGQGQISLQKSPAVVNAGAGAGPLNIPEYSITDYNHLVSGRLATSYYAHNWLFGNTKFVQMRGGKATSTGTYSLFTRGNSSAQSSGKVYVQAIYGTPSSSGSWEYVISGNKNISLINSNTSIYSGSTPSIYWSGDILYASNGDASTYYTVIVELHNIGDHWDASFGNFPGFIS